MGLVHPSEEDWVSSLGKSLDFTITSMFACFPFIFVKPQSEHIVRGTRFQYCDIRVSKTSVYSEKLFKSSHVVYEYKTASGTKHLFWD